MFTLIWVFLVVAAVKDCGKVDKAKAATLLAAALLADSAVAFSLFR